MKATRKQIMDYVGNSKYDAVPVEIVPSKRFAPHEVGEPWHYETRGGRYIYHPSAYSKKGWSNMVYCHSNRCVRVGELWEAS